MTTDDGRLKPGWMRVAFGDMATCVNERIEDAWRTRLRGT